MYKFENGLGSEKTNKIPCSWCRDVQLKHIRNQSAVKWLLRKLREFRLGPDYQFDVEHNNVKASY